MPGGGCGLRGLWRLLSLGSAPFWWVRVPVGPLSRVGMRGCVAGAWSPGSAAASWCGWLPETAPPKLMFYFYMYIFVLVYPLPPPMLVPQQDKRLSIKVSEALTVCVWKADLTKFHVDAVVNAANKSLNHAGGLAQALVQAGGQVIAKESDQHIRNLPCKYVIHAVGPRFKKKNPSSTVLSKAKDTLKNAIESILQKVDELKIQSVAIPAISSGIFQFPFELFTVEKEEHRSGRGSHTICQPVWFILPHTSQ
uniref:Macro domain-containing protein n=1 Tax=Sphaeramia orbicularis TaxID=375764 RepID=A0A673A5W9_9TELE